MGEAAAAAVKRTHLDERIAKCALRAGADLKEGFEVTKGSTIFDREKGLWKVTSAEVGHHSTSRFLLTFSSKIGMFGKSYSSK